jgi:hypothetical protein
MSSSVLEVIAGLRRVNATVVPTCVVPSTAVLSDDSGDDLWLDEVGKTVITSNLLLVLATPTYHRLPPSHHSLEQPEVLMRGWWR